MKKKLENFIITSIVVLMLGGVITGSVAFETWRWHKFQEITHSHVSFLTWYVVLGHK